MEGFLLAQPGNARQLTVTCSWLEDSLSLMKPGEAARFKAQCAEAGLMPRLLRMARSPELASHTPGLESAFSLLTHLAPSPVVAAQLEEEGRARLQNALEAQEKARNLASTVMSAPWPGPNPALEEQGLPQEAWTPPPRQARPRSATHQALRKATMQAPLSSPKLRGFLSPLRKVAQDYDDHLVEKQEAAENARKLHPLTHPRVPVQARRRPMQAAPLTSPLAASLRERARQERVRSKAETLLPSDQARLARVAPFEVLAAGYRTRPRAKSLPSPYAENLTRAYRKPRKAKEDASAQLSNLMAASVPREHLCELYPAMRHATGLHAAAREGAPAEPSVLLDFCSAKRADERLAGRRAEEKRELREALSAQLQVPLSPLQDMVDQRARARRRATDSSLQPVPAEVRPFSPAPTLYSPLFRRPTTPGLHDVGGLPDYLALYHRSLQRYDDEMQRSAYQAVQGGVASPSSVIASVVRPLPDSSASAFSAFPASKRDPAPEPELLGGDSHSAQASPSQATNQHEMLQDAVHGTLNMLITHAASKASLASPCNSSSFGGLSDAETQAAVNSWLASQLEAATSRLV